MNIAAFYNIAAMGHWREIVFEQLRLLSEANFDEVIRVSFIGALSDYQYVVDIAALLSIKVELIYRSTNLTDFEYPSIRAIQTLCRDGYNGAILYFHTKGVSRVGAHPVNWWRWLMNSHILTRWKVCIDDLNVFDVAGVCWNSCPSHHFCGNFWWARAEWIRRLEDFDDYRTHRYSGWGDHRGPLYYQRYACELWISKDSVGFPERRVRSYFISDAPIWSAEWWVSDLGVKAKHICLAEGA